MTKAQQRLYNVGQFLKAKMGQPVKLPCPHCGNEGPHDVNDDHREPTMLCEACGIQTDVEVFVRGGQ